MYNENHEVLKARPNIILFSGFLGSGKTSLMLKSIEILSKAGKRCAIIINEIGDIGIDNRQMRMLGYNVLDLFGGCVCCTMKVTLEATINHLLEEEEDLDYILFEPSGLSNPQSLYPAIINCGYEQSEIQNIFIFDVSRNDFYKNRMSQLFADSLKLTRCVVINKIDKVSQDEIDAAKIMVKETRPEISVFKMNLNDELDQKFAEFLVGGM
ncbi:GTP-binding protein [Eubacteriaceae bacterium ES2]|nr:GTP-binding protein [Eubacteriaceae bacterium ES2]